MLASRLVPRQSRDDRQEERISGRAPPGRMVADELDEGRQRLARAVRRPGALPVFVPPWNRFAGRFVPLLAEAGSDGACRSRRRARQPLPAGHRGDRCPCRRRRLARRSRLCRRRRGAWPARRPNCAGGGRPGDGSAIGILTHHLVMDDATEDFLARLGGCGLAPRRALAWRGRHSGGAMTQLDTMRGAPPDSRSAIRLSGFGDARRLSARRRGAGAERGDPRYGVGRQRRCGGDRRVRRDLRRVRGPHRAAPRHQDRGHRDRGARVGAPAHARSTGPRSTA